MPKILILSGPSGSGKTTLARALLRQLPSAGMIPSITTRERRESDLPGEYEYITPDEFAYRRDEEKILLWHITRGSTSYGTQRDDVFAACDGEFGQVAIMILVPDKVHDLNIIVRGQYRDDVPVVPIYILPPDESIIRRRLIERGESEASIEERLALEQNWLRESRASPTSFRYVLGGNDLTELPRAIADIRFELGE